MGISGSVARQLYRLLSERFDDHGKFYFEMWIRTPRSGKVACDMAIFFPNPKFGRSRDEDRNLLVGIEVKNWKANPVTPSVIKEEFNGYRHQFDRFYLAAPEFSPTVDTMFEANGDDEWEHRLHCGLIEMGEPYEVLEPAYTQPTNSTNRRKFIKRIYTNWSENSDRLETLYPEIYAELEGVPRDPELPDPGQYALGEFAEAPPNT